MTDRFKLFNVPKQRCSVCAPYRGENEGLRPQKAKARCKKCSKLSSSH